jgi:hypothetical protein
MRISRLHVRSVLGATLATAIAIGLVVLGVWAQGPAGVQFPASEMLTRPTANSVMVSAMADAPIEAYFEYGTDQAKLGSRTKTAKADANEVAKTLLDGLKGNTRYFYRMVYRPKDAKDWVERPVHTFMTQRAPGSAFTFAITADSHVNILLGNARIWRQTMEDIAKDQPDFLFDLGDTFSMDNVNTVEEAEKSYLYQRPFFEIPGASSPIFLALGNHEEEEGWHLDDVPDEALSKPVMGANARKKYFPGPVPDKFYTGNKDKQKHLTGDHLREDYYAFEWGDALFITIDPFWYSMTKPFKSNMGGGENFEPGSGDRWDWTLGRAQYDWLQRTLESSHAKYKFMFAHQGTGGTDDYIRAGAYGASYNEWGGLDTDGKTNSFAKRRPGWPKPVHQVLVDGHLTAFFHAHDHQYVYEIRDNVVYQEVPMAAEARYSAGFNEYSEDNPWTKKKLPNTGYLRVTVAPSESKVDYVMSVAPAAEVAAATAKAKEGGKAKAATKTGDGQAKTAAKGKGKGNGVDAATREPIGKNGEVVYSYTMAPFPAAK